MHLNTHSVGFPAKAGQRAVTGAPPLSGPSGHCVHSPMSQWSTPNKRRYERVAVHTVFPCTPQDPPPPRVQFFSLYGTPCSWRQVVVISTVHLCSVPDHAVRVAFRALLT